MQQVPRCFRLALIQMKIPLSKENVSGPRITNTHADCIMRGSRGMVCAQPPSLSSIIFSRAKTLSAEYPRSKTRWLLGLLRRFRKGRTRSQLRRMSKYHPMRKRYLRNILLLDWIRFPSMCYRLWHIFLIHSAHLEYFSRIERPS